MKDKRFTILVPFKNLMRKMQSYSLLAPPEPTMGSGIKARAEVIGPTWSYRNIVMVAGAEALPAVSEAMTWIVFWPG